MATTVSVGGGSRCQGAKRRPVNRPFSVCVAFGRPLTPPRPKRETQSSCSRDYLCLLALSSVQVVNFHHSRHSQHITQTGMPPSKDNGYFSFWTQAHFPAVATVITPQLQATHNLELPSSHTHPPTPATAQTVSQSVSLAGSLRDGSFGKKRQHVPK